MPNICILSNVQHCYISTLGIDASSFALDTTSAHEVKAQERIGLEWNRYKLVTRDHFCMFGVTYILLDLTLTSCRCCSQPFHVRFSF